MINFFRKTRKKMADDNKPMKYMRYAIGEIVLVVIGILIALSINNWNEDRKRNKQEKLLLVEIHNEFKYNKSELASTVLGYDRVKINLSSIIDLFPIDIQTVNYDSLAVFLKNTTFTGTFDYSNTSIEKIRNSSSYDMISNVELRNLLLQWDSILQDYLERELSARDHYFEKYVAFLNKHIPRPYDKGFKDPRIKLQFLTSIEFENLVKHRRRRITVMLGMVKNSNQQKNIVAIMDKIIEFSGKE